MYHLNSVLIEGIVLRLTPETKDEPAGAWVEILVASHSRRAPRKGKKFTGVTSFFSIWLATDKVELVDALYRKPRLGQGVRVVGRLTEDRTRDPEGNIHSACCVEAEHLEYRDWPKEKVTDAGLKRLLALMEEPNEEELCS
jgi:single-strand DNA-binding protein